MRFELLILISLIAAIPLIAAKEFKIRNQKDVENAHRLCFLEHKPPMKLFEKYQKLEFPKHKATACYMQCLLEKLHFFDKAQDHFHMDNIMTQLVGEYPEHSAPTKRALNKCMAKKLGNSGDDACACTSDVFRCFMHENKEVVLKSFAP